MLHMADENPLILIATMCRKNASYIIKDGELENLKGPRVKTRELNQSKSPTDWKRYMV